MMHIYNNFFDKFPIIQHECFKLRELTSDDAEMFYNYMTNENVSRFLSDEDIPKDLISAKSELAYWSGLFKNKRSIYWGIAISNQLIGTCGFNNWNRTHKRCEISYDLSYDYWGQGIMTDVINIVTNFAFEKMEVNRVQATAAIDNVGSIKVLEKNNYVVEGRLAKYGILHDISKDYYIYSKVR